MQEGDQMAEQWEEEQHLEEIVERRRRMERNCLKLDAMHKVPELVANERMIQGQRVKYTKVKKEVPGWSTEEMKERPNVAMEEDTEEMKRWRGPNQSEMDPWRRKSWTSTKSKRAKGWLLKAEVTSWNGEEYARTRDFKLESGEKTAVREFSLFREYNLQRLRSKQEESTEEEEMKQQQKMVIMKDLTRKIRSKGRMDAENRWSELRAKDCEKA